MIIQLSALIALQLGASIPNKSNEWSCYGQNLIPQHNLTLFGEIHGTYEAPNIVAEHICEIAKKKMVVLVLEIPIEEQENVNQYLSSQGRREDRKRFVSSDYWSSDWQDGRASIAMFSLIDRVRKLKSDGAKIFIITDDGFGEKDHDLKMSSVLSKATVENPAASIVGLFGNYHTGEIVGTRSNPNQQRIGYRLKKLDPLTISIEFDRGWAWSCSLQCGITKMGPWSGTISEPKFEYVKDERNGHDAVLILPKADAAPPAKYMAFEG